MNARALLALSLALLAGCRTVTLTRPAAAETTRAEASARPPLTFSLRYTRGPDSLLAEARDYDGEHLYVETARVRDHLLATGAFGSAQRAADGAGLHCELHLTHAFHAGTQLMSVVLTAGVAPDRHQSDYVLTARVRAPGRAPQDYDVRCQAVTWVWVPLLPIGLGQLALQTDPLQQAFDALADALRADGWLAR